MGGQREGKDLERAVIEAVAERRTDLVELAERLIAFDTAPRGADDPPGQAVELQEMLAARLRACGAEIDLWEPDADAVGGHPQVPAEISFAGQPQLIARLAGASRDRSLLFNGHVDVVPSGPAAGWTGGAFSPQVRDGRLYGRGACDMKGGVAAMVLAVETLAELGVETPASLLVNTVTFEETSGAGTLASLARGLRADAAIVPEPTGFGVHHACRGILNLTVTVPGRAGHATFHQPDWREGGAVNAIEMARVVLDAAVELRDRWAARPDLEHEHLPPPSIVPTLIEGGEWKVSYPSACEVFFDIAYLPAQADADGVGGAARAEIAAWLEERSAREPWLADNPIRLEWGIDLPPAEVAPDAGIVACMHDAAQQVRPTVPLGALDSWHDAASLIRVGGIPTVDFGPANAGEDGRTLMHAADEYVRVDELVECSQALALAALRFE